MIEQPTTFVIGAGASMPYYLPSGVELLQKARNIKPGDSIYPVLIDGPDQSERVGLVNTFLEAVRSHPGPSIDAFLEDRPYFRNIGHEVIAALMGTEISKATLTRKTFHKAAENDDWIAYLIEKLREGAGSPEKLAQNPIKFVSFNFDSVIEESFEKAIVGLYGKGAGLDFPRVIHVHGRLPKLTSLNRDWVTAAANNVKVIRDELDPHTLHDARQAIVGARVICFLGFSFHPENLNTLDVRGGERGPTREFFGSAFGLEEGEKARIRSRFRPSFHRESIILGDTGTRNREFLRKHHVLR